MTPQEAIDKIVLGILETPDGWKLESKIKILSPYSEKIRDQIRDQIMTPPIKDEYERMEDEHKQIAAFAETL